MELESNLVSQNGKEEEKEEVVKEEEERRVEEEAVEVGSLFSFDYYANQIEQVFSFFSFLFFFPFFLSFFFFLFFFFSSLFFFFSSLFNWCDSTKNKGTQLASGSRFFLDINTFQYCIEETNKKKRDK